MAGIVPFSLTGKRVWVAGATGMLGNALCERLRYEKCEVIITSREKLNLCRQSDVENWMSQTKPQVIFFADGCTRGNDQFHFSVDRSGIKVGEEIKSDVTPLAYPIDKLPDRPKTTISDEFLAYKMLGLLPKD